MFICSWAVHVRNFSVFEQRLRPARGTIEREGTEETNFPRKTSQSLSIVPRAQTLLENPEIAKMHSLGTQTHQVSFIYFILVFDI